MAKANEQVELGLVKASKLNILIFILANLKPVQLYLAISPKYHFKAPENFKICYRTRQKFKDQMEKFGGRNKKKYRRQ